MHRRNFIKTGCIACVGSGIGVLLLESCSAAKILDASIIGSDMIVPLKDFEVKKKNQIQYKKYLVAQNELLQYPICVYRFDENNYEAIWMQCTHQGAELQVFGDKLQCPAHGSEFDSHGKVENGPANDRLRTFPVTVADKQLKISLKK